MGLREELEQATAAAEPFSAEGERVAAVLAAEPVAGRRVYLCAYEVGEERTWLALDDAGEPVRDRAAVREAVSLTALCEVAGDTAGGGHLDELRSRLAALRITESPPGIDEAEKAAVELERVVGAVPRVASPNWLDEVGAAARRLERALGDDTRSPFAEAMQAAMGAVDALAAEVEARYKLSLI